MRTTVASLKAVKITPEQILPKTEPAAGDRKCPDCGKSYGKIRRCYGCHPGNRGKATADQSANGHPKNRLASVEALNFADGEPGRRDGTVRAELRAMSEVLVIAEKLGPEAARRMLNWVADRLGIADRRL